MIALNKARALEAANVELQRKLAERDNQMATFSAAFNEYRAAVAARRKLNLSWSSSIVRPITHGQKTSRAARGHRGVGCISGGVKS
jgi:hypothetical protein